MLALASVANGQDAKMRLGGIEFFGYAGLNLDQVKAALPLHEGDELPQTQAAVNGASSQVRDAVQRTTGHAPTDVQFTCCNERGTWMVFIGLQGRTFRPVPYNPAPTCAAQLPPQIVSLYHQFGATLSAGLQHGQAGEDDSKGYALAAYPPLRAKQLAMREYAVGHAQLLRRVLTTAADVEQRRVAAQLLGYAPQSTAQIAALVQASRDADDEVRNNAVRALGVLARSNAKVAARIPARDFINGLNSGVWSDRNKSAELLALLTQRRDPKLLAQLRARALDSLIEMARWHDNNHASPVRIMLGRIAGIEEARLVQLVQAGRVDEIIDALNSRQKRAPR